MQSLKLVSEDSRRKLFEFGEGIWKVAKYIEVSQDCEIGSHYHKEKDEFFLLIDGEMEYTLASKSDVSLTYYVYNRRVTAPFAISVPRGTFHTFKIKAGSRMIGLCSELFNKCDDHI